MASTIKSKDEGRYAGKAVYTVPGLNSDGCKKLPGLYLSGSEGAFPNETGLLKLLYGGIGKASGKCTMPIANRGQTLPQLAVCFDGRTALSGCRI
ncbi:hypothetical protein [Neisseria iguanae]|uniref:Uncharacterized protein n=1 Tax=Neisseria iguanae TaxID=90242 RepID=A0A2P7U1C0_9NEIS|nr:hypothetical protein [Neisseria iguanae]PSJ80759.1 hypothetical protein C7N83_04155 [Neisseria iguanae]